MKLYMLHESRLGPLPKGISELEVFDDHLVIVVGDNEERVQGRSVYLEGPKELFIEWLKPFDGVWVGQGAPAEERFEVCYIKVEGK